MKKRCILGNNSGISLITVIITIVVIIILATIVWFASFDTPDNAVVAKYVQEFEEVRKGVETKRLINSENGLEYIDKGFSMVKVSGEIPYNFMSVSSGEKAAYLVDLNYIGYDALTIGRAYRDFKPEGNNIKTVVFGRDDVFVYDSSGRVFYVKGFVNGGKTYHEDLEKDEPIIIKSIDKVVNPERTEVQVTIEIESDNPIVSVKVGDKEATDIGDGKYVVTITENGNYPIIVEDEKGNTAKDKVNIKEIGTNPDGIPTVTARVINGTYENGKYIIYGNTAEIELISETAKFLHIDNIGSSPSSWLSFTTNVERYFTTPGENRIYIWVKDENGKISERCELIIEVKTNVVKPEYSGEQIGDGDIIFEVVPENTTWSKSKQVKIIYTEGMQSNNYYSEYRIKGKAGDWSKWRIAYDNELLLDVTQSGTRIQAQIRYKSTYSEKNIALEEIEIINIDRNPPRIDSFVKDSADTIKGKAQDSESGLADYPYLITLEYIDFAVENIEDFTWVAPDASGYVTATIETDGKYYLYAKDKAGNVAVATLNAEAPDKTAPEIKSVEVTPILDYAIIKASATDNRGITGYAITKDGDTIPTDWVYITESQEVLIEKSNIMEDGDYFIWVRDAAGNTAVEKATVATYKFPEFDVNYPKTVHTQVGNKAEFEVKFSKEGSPNVYEYSWYESKDNGNTWTLIAGATSSKYTITSTKQSDNGKLFKCVINHARGKIDSPIAKLELFTIGTDAPSATVEEEKEMILVGVSINNGATITRSNTLSVKVAAINAAQVNISENGQKTGNWVMFQDTISYELKDTSNGTKTISVWIRDAEGKELNKVVTAQIEKIDSGE